MDAGKLIAELQHSARLGKTFPIGVVGGSEKLGIRLKLSTAGAGTLLSLAIIVFIENISVTLLGRCSCQQCIPRV